MNHTDQTTPSRPTLLVMAGGTGGHIFPALAVADVLRDAGWDVLWLGNPDGMEARLVPQHGYAMRWLNFGALRGKGMLRKLLLPWNLLKGFAQAVSVLREVRPTVVLGMGGYVTFPAGMMAALLGYPLVIHEQNSIAGLANRVLAKVANRVLTGFPNALPNSEWVGNPVRAAITQQVDPQTRFAGREGALRLLVVGGSLGAQALNEIVPQGLAQLPLNERPIVVHQAGERHLHALQANYAKAGVAAECVAFIDDMASSYANADVVICRAGALTVAEVACVGLPALFIPYPFAVDDHQTSNAAFLVKEGGAECVAQSELSPAHIVKLVRHSRQELARMAALARQQAKPEASQRVAQVCQEFLL